MTNHDQLMAKAKQAITDVFSDTTIEIEQCRDSLNVLKEEIDVLLDTL